MSGASNLFEVDDSMPPALSDKQLMRSAGGAAGCFMVVISLRESTWRRRRLSQVAMDEVENGLAGRAIQ